MQDMDRIEYLHDLWALFALTSEALHSAFKEEAREYGITPIKGAVIFWIDALGDKATAPEIGRSIFRRRHSMSELLIRMERAGLVRRFHDLPKKNTVRYELTEKGRELHRRNKQRNVITRIFASLSQEQNQQLQPILHKLFSEAIKELKIKYNMPLPFNLRIRELL